MHSKWCVTSRHKSKFTEQNFLQSFQISYDRIIHELRKRRGLGKSFKLFNSILEIFHLREKKCTQKTLLNNQSHEQELNSSQRNTFQEIYGFFSFPARPWGHGEAVWHRLRDEGESSENYFSSFFTISNFAVTLTDIFCPRPMWETLWRTSRIKGIRCDWR